MSTATTTAIASTPAQVFESRLLRIPDYQRGYAWEAMQLDEFLEDLELLPVGKVHYTGTLVLQQVTTTQPIRDCRGKPYEVFDVVDGQQRLTTIVILLDAVRRQLLTLNMRDFANGIRDTFLYVKDRNEQPLPKLTLNRDCHAFFLDHILFEKPCLHGNKMRSHRNLAYAKQHFDKYLSDTRAQEPNFQEWLESLRDKICDQLSLTLYFVQQSADAGVIFEVMNNRGRPITELEKVKNYLLYLTSQLSLDDPHDLADRINECWAHLFERLMAANLATADNEEALLRTHWFIAYHPDPHHWQGSKSIKAKFHLREYVGRHNDLLADLKQYVETLRNTATAYCDAVNPHHSDAFLDLRDSPEVLRKILSLGDKLHRLRVVALYVPLLVSIRLRFPNDGKYYAAALHICELYAFRAFRVLGKKSNAGRSSIILCAKALYEGKYSIETTLEALAALVWKYSPNQEFDWAIANRKNWYSWSGIKYLLYEYEEHLARSRNRNMKITWSTLECDVADHTIEHILPRTPTDPYWTDRFSPEQHAELQHNLGNLCLTLDNSTYYNYSFTRKKGTLAATEKCYANGDLVMERDLAKFADWTPEAIEQRRAAMIHWIGERWSITANVAKAHQIDTKDDDDDVQDLTVDDVIKDG